MMMNALEAAAAQKEAMKNHFNFCITEVKNVGYGGRNHSTSLVSIILFVLIPSTSLCFYLKPCECPSFDLSLSLSLSLKVLKLGVLFLLDHLFLIFLPRSFASL
jgi:hypothetical protein